MEDGSNGWRRLFRSTLYDHEDLGVTNIPLSVRTGSSAISLDHLIFLLTVRSVNLQHLCAIFTNTFESALRKAPQQ